MQHTDQSETREEVLEVIRNLPGASSTEIRELMPHVGYGAVMNMLSYLKRKGIIIESGKKPYKKSNGILASVSCYQLNPDPDPKPLPPKYRRGDRSAKPTESALELRVAELEAELERLREWQRVALDRYPDLAVEPVILRARKVVAAELRQSGDTVMAHQVERGDKDSTTLVRAVARALELAE